ncbi:MAG: hypothetical protein JST00_32380 [Deltaproteobacteria bacterium]|nr:hypothetical protein [Deltaproteobacteria bacterium]
MNRRALAALALALATLGAAPRAAAQPSPMPASELNAEARAHYKQGTEALNAGRFAEAALHFETASSKTPHAVSWFMAAEAWERASRPERAADALARALDVPGLSAELGEKIRGRLASLEATIGTVVLGGASSYRASIDGATAVAPPARLHGLPGTHVVTIIPPDRARSRREVVLTAGARVTLTLGEGEEEEKTPAPPPKVEVRYVEREVERPAEVRRYVGFGVIGLGAAALAGSAILGASALDAKDAYASARTQESYDHVRSVQAWSNVTLVAGLAMLAGGVALVVWPSADKAKSPAASTGTSIAVVPSGAVLRGSF